MFPPGDYEDEFESNAVADEDIASMVVEECQVTTLMSCRPMAQGLVLERRREVLIFLRQAVTDQLMPTDHFFFAVQVLDAAGVWTSLDEPQQVVAAVAALYMGAKLQSHAQDTVAELLDEFAALATLFVQRKRPGFHVLLADICLAENHILEALNFSVSAPTVREWIEVFFKRADVVSAERLTPRLRFAAEVAQTICEHLVLQVQFSKLTSASMFASNAWFLAWTITCAMLQ
mmetsp:Transcript_24924/g.65447  ORF Transcript_24924/g.65447 Transcript_24924/m.65447 type:complete len:232 (-) Transcript_24924:476-1171(-)